MTLLDPIPVNIIISVLGIYLLLVIAQITLLVLKKTYKDKNFHELTLRIKSWWFMITVFTLALVISKYLSLFLLAMLSFLALKEYFSMIPTRRSDRRVIFWAYMTIPCQFYFAAISWYGMFIIFIPVYMFLLIPTRMIFLGETRNFLSSVGTIHWGLMTTVYCLSHASYLLGLKVNVDLPAGNAGLLLFLVFLTQLNDVAQYFWGKLFGRRKIAPTISSGKTIIGFLGGVGTTTLCSAGICLFLTPLSLMHGLCVGFLISVGGFVGDINISAVKRDLGIKDSGQLIPGHGGILDRVDSLTFTAPLFFHYLNYFYV